MNWPGKLKKSTAVRSKSIVNPWNDKGKLKEIFDSFCKESHEELFETQQEAIEFYSKEENYQKLVSGDIGDNLLGKYWKLISL